MREERRRLVYDVVQRTNRGESIRQIARVLGKDRKTIARVIKKHQARLEQGDDALARELSRPQRTPRASKLDRYTQRIEQLLNDPALAGITAQRVFEIIKEEGFDGGYTIVREHVRSVQPKAFKRAHDPVVNPPGKQGQFDWSPYVLSGCGVKVESFSLTLHYSSYQYVAFTRDRKRPTLLQHFVAAFEDFGGVPDEVVFDSEKTVIDRWELGKPIVNLEFLDFATYYGFHVHVAPRADGAYKGNVGRSHWTVERNFLNGRTFHDLEDARGRLALWRTEFSERKHRTKGRTRLEMYLEEKPMLQALPPRPYDTSQVVWRIVDGFHRVLFETNTYTVPREYVGARLCLKIAAERVFIYDGGARLLATHERAPRGAKQAQELSEHRRASRIDIDQVIARFALWGEEASTFATRLRARQRYAGRELSAVLTLQSRYRVEDILRAIRHALEFDACHAKAVDRILQVQATPLDLQDVVAHRIRADIRRALHRAPVRQRELDTYQRLLSGRDDDTEVAHDEREPDTS